MARIRTLKPEFPQSESMGRVSRDARLLFLMLFTIVDDEGRTRAASRMLASLLYPYDDDAKTHIVEWMLELERQRCVTVYEVDGNVYLQIEKWLSHQKIDRPSPSRLPAPPSKPREPSRALAADLVPRIKDQEGISKKVLSPHGDEQTKSLFPEIAPSAPVTVVPVTFDPLERAKDAYNLTAEFAGWPQCQRLTDARRKALKARLDECGGLQGWTEAMARAARSSFLLGKTGRSGDHAKWRPNIKFFLQQESFTTLMEGGYDDPDNSQGPSPGSSLGRIAEAAAIALAGGDSSY